MFHIGRSVVMKDTLKYLLTLPPEEGFIMTTKSEIQQLLQCLWSLEYHNAGLSATAELSKASEVMNDLEANVREFKVLDNEENRLCSQWFACRKRKDNLKRKSKS